MDRETYLVRLEADSAALLAAHQEAPSAPAWEGLGWDRTRLLAHVGEVHLWMRTQLALGSEEMIDFAALEGAPTGAELPAWFAAGAAELAARIEAMDVDATWPTWAGPQPGWFFPRRAAQETAVHRWDADQQPIDGELSVDGIDELLELFAPYSGGDRLAGVEASIHLHATDRDGEWLVHLGAGGVRFEHGHAKGDVALRGTASDLLLWAWNRVPVDERFEVFGDRAPLEAWREAVRF